MDVIDNTEILFSATPFNFVKPKTHHFEREIVNRFQFKQMISHMWT
jgi:hypothetical protein